MKKIAIIENGWGKFINYAWTLGLKQYMEDHDVDANIYIFNSFGNVSLDEKFNTGEYNITNLPDLKSFDGIFLELTNFGDADVKREIIERVKESGVPAVSIVEEIPGLYYAGIDNYVAMRQMVEHLVIHHHCRKINYVGGPVSSGENMDRLRAYKDVLIENGIPFEPDRVFHNNYEIITGELAFEHFYSRGLMPQAFVCANDNIAVGICHQAKKRGFQIPDDLLVTGFDDFDKAAFYSPRISTIGFKREAISYAAMEIMSNIWNGTQTESAILIQPHTSFQDSCGCVPARTLDRGEFVNERIMSEDVQWRMQNRLQELKRELLNCNNFVEMAACLPKSLSVVGYEEIYIMLNRDLYEMLEREEEPQYRIFGYPDDMKVLLAAMPGCILGGLKREPGRLIPGVADDEGGSTYLFSPLHLRDREIGYTVLKNCDHLMDSSMLYELLNIILETVQNIYNRMVLARMNDKLSRLYIRDSLTGLYNRMAYNQFAIPKFEQCMQNGLPLLIMFWDLDRLKYINDTFGHDMGNTAIVAITDSIRDCCPADAIAMRYGGDEFIVLEAGYETEQAEQLIADIENEIARKRVTLKTPFELKASVGYVIASDPTKSLNDYINQADEGMYRNKNARKERESREAIA
jgi:diguanylate cyclase (GGDEF)-like protein